MPNTGDFAIVIGVDEYVNLRPLKGPVNDANQFQEWVCAADGGGVPEGNCYLIPNSRDPIRPLQDDIDDALEKIIGTADVRFRRFYFFFAGHGMGITWEQNGLCLPKWSMIQRNYALSSKGYLNYIVETSLFAEVYFFIDCCRSRELSVIPSNTRLNAIRGRGGDVSSLVVYAAPFENTAGEAPEGNAEDSLVRGFFSRSLVEGLKGAAADDRNAITAKSLIDYCRRRTDELARDNNCTQMVRTEFNDGGRSLEDLIICNAQPRAGIEVMISFAREGRFRLLGPDLAQISDWNASAGMEQGGLYLRSGIYCIEDTQTSNKQFFVIDGHTNTFRVSAD